MLSSKILRFQWLQSRRKLVKRLRQANFGTKGHLSDDLDLMHLDRALVKSSTLLIGYAIEMYLKAGLTTSMVGCPEELFTSQCRKFSHNYADIAEFICWPADLVDLEDLAVLSDAVKADARYPVSVAKDEDYISKTNERRQRLSDNARYKRYRLLAKRIDIYTTRLLGITNDPLDHGSRKLDGDGYFCYRMGGGMPPRITFKKGSANTRSVSCADDLKPIVAAASPILGRIWDEVEIYEHSVKGKRPAVDRVK